MTDVAADPGPSWLSAWRAGQADAAGALSRFDGLPGVERDEMVGRWLGESLPTGHLDRLGWWGKAVEGLDRVHPLLFRGPSGRMIPLEPALMPLRIALAWPALARSRVTRATFMALRPALRARRHAATLRVRDFRGARSAAIVYAGQPITDHLRRVDASRVVGLMERPGMATPFFFLLTRNTGG